MPDARLKRRDYIEMRFLLNVMIPVYAQYANY